MRVCYTHVPVASIERPRAYLVVYNHFILCIYLPCICADVIYSVDEAVGWLL